MKIIIDCDEWYPVYTASIVNDDMNEETLKYYSRSNKLFEVPDEFMKDYEKMMANFDDFQNKLREL